MAVVLLVLLSFRHLRPFCLQECRTSDQVPVMWRLKGGRQVQLPPERETKGSWERGRDPTDRRDECLTLTTSGMKLRTEGSELCVVGEWGTCLQTPDRIPLWQLWSELFWRVCSPVSTSEKYSITQSESRVPRQLCVHKNVCIDNAVCLLSLLPGGCWFLGGLDSILVLTRLIRPLTSGTGFKALSGGWRGWRGHGDLRLPALNVSTCFLSYVWLSLGCVRTKSVGNPRRESSRRGCTLWVSLSS